MVHSFICDSYTFIQHELSIARIAICSSTGPQAISPCLWLAHQGCPVTRTSRHGVVWWRGSVRLVIVWARSPVGSGGWLVKGSSYRAAHYPQTEKSPGNLYAISFGEGMNWIWWIFVIFCSDFGLISNTTNLESRVAGWIIGPFALAFANQNGPE